jgi:imidazole glycerol-phosphate synthase subunit HisF
MLQTRIIPTLLLRNESLVKTIRFGRFTYVGDPCNTVRIFNELEVDELLFLDISATLEKRSPNRKVLKEIASECFMPLAYGGGVRTIEDTKVLFEIGFEKIVINSYSVENPSFIRQLSERYGNQAIIASIDVRKNFRHQYGVYTHAGKKNVHRHPVEWAKQLENLGAGEILLTNIDREGTWSGYDLELTKMVAEAVTIPVIAHGGAGNINHIEDAVKQGKASAVALGSMVVFQKQGMGVLVNFPDSNHLRKVLP